MFDKEFYPTPPELIKKLYEPYQSKGAYRDFIKYRFEGAILDPSAGKGDLLKFKNERLWNEFNMRACAGKNWLPNDERKKWEETKKEPVTDEPLLLFN